MSSDPNSAPNGGTPMQPVFPLKVDPIYGFYKMINTTEESLIQDFIALIMTNPGEGINDAELGIGIERYLFEQQSSDMLIDLQSRIIDQTRQHLESVKLLKLELITPDSAELLGNQNLINIKITFLVNGSTVAEARTERTANNRIKVVIDGVSKYTSSFRDRIQNLPSDETQI